MNIISLEEKPFTVWLKEFAPWEPKILQPHCNESDSDEAIDEESCDDNSDTSDNVSENGDADNDISNSGDGRSEEFDQKLCNEASVNFDASLKCPPDENSFFNTKVSTDDNPINMVQETKLDQEKSVSVEEEKVNNNSGIKGPVLEQEKKVGSDTVGCKIPSGLDPEVSPSSKMNEGGPKQFNMANECDQNSGESDDIFSLDKIIQNELNKSKGQKSRPPVIRSCQVSTSESSGAPGFVKGVYLQTVDKMDNEQKKSCVDMMQFKANGSSMSFMESSNGVDKTNEIMEVGKFTGFEVEDDARSFEQIVSRMSGDKGFL